MLRVGIEGSRTRDGPTKSVVDLRKVINQALNFVLKEGFKRIMKLFFLKSILFSATFAVSFSGVVAFAASASQPYVLITDVDDTIKVSHVLDPISKVIRFLDEPVSFAGMSTLYQAMIQEAEMQGARPNFAVLSGTPRLFESSIWNFLELFNFPEPTSVTTRPLLENTQNYKTGVVRKIVAKTANKGGTMILIGDDTEFDFAAYRDATRKRRQKGGGKTEIYIRRVSGQANSLTGTIGGSHAFDSAADIAILEFVAGRLSRSAVEVIFNEIETEMDPQRLFVPEEYCASGDRTRLSKRFLEETTKKPQVPAELVQRLVKVEDHLRERCDSMAMTFAELFELKKSFIIKAAQ